ncbi:radical SAM protein [Spirochaetia bacterium]|nr:radical SAM protein [Spirochaetia bacterium]
MKKVSIYLVQPPLTQLNGPYPSLYYLKPFLEKLNYAVEVRDHSIGLFEKIFCKAGLEKIFSDAAKNADFQKKQNKKTRYYLDRFFSEKHLWFSVIDHLIDFLRGRDREWGHLLSLSNGTVPGGPRFDDFLKLASGQTSPEVAPLMASKLLADLADFITVSLDPSFALVRYIPNLAESVGGGDFKKLQAGLNGYIMQNFYRPFLDDEWADMSGDSGQPFILGITIPFPGCLAGALVCAESAKKQFREKVSVIAGGGYVNTELRFMECPEFFDYVDYLSFDRGYGSWTAILEHLGGKDKGENFGEKPLYKTIYRSAKTGRIVSGTEIADEIYSKIDKDAVKTIFPDYAGVDFSRYICPVDDTNPMHRLWSDGHWLKACLAQGCYWHRCVFCDTTLDYIHTFQSVEVKALYAHLLKQVNVTGVRGLHLVDEAAPPSSLLRLAELNREASLPVVFWGNIRFDEAFSPDVAAFLAAGALVGVSAGIEIATETGLKKLDKGINLETLVRVCAAFKEAGVLVHGYLIYGYWDEDDQEIIDSAEIVRQFFEAGLLDSAFWHKFVLTRHSRLYGEWQKGLHQGLVPRGDHSAFALNDLRFYGEEKSDKFTEGLDRLLAAWMAGDTAAAVGAAFPFKTPYPSVEPDMVSHLLDSYARRRDKDRAAIPVVEAADRVIFLGSRPIIQKAGEKTALFWRWRLEDILLKISSGETKQAEKMADLLVDTSRSPGMKAGKFYQQLEEIFGDDDGDAKKIWKNLRNGGLVKLPETKGEK